MMVMINREYALHILFLNVNHKYCQVFLAVFSLNLGKLVSITKYPFFSCYCYKTECKLPGEIVWSLHNENGQYYLDAA